MATEKKRTAIEIRERSSARYSEIPIPCLHCKNIVAVGNQHEPDGWTCEAFPEQIPYFILTMREPHTKVTMAQRGEAVYEPTIYKDDDSGREWHYTGDGRWVYVDGLPDR